MTRAMGGDGIADPESGAHHVDQQVESVPSLPGIGVVRAVTSRPVTVFGVDRPSLMALATVAALPVLLVYGLAQRRLREGLTVGVGK